VIEIPRLLSDLSAGEQIQSEAASTEAEQSGKDEPTIIDAAG
jgi:hypothetical protein